MLQPTAEQIVKPCQIAESNWQQRSQRTEDEQRKLQAIS
jgi:hypothetical protein